MRFDAQSPYIWREINQRVKDQLNCHSKVYVYRGLHQALFEICLGLNLRFSHKRKIIVQAGFGDHLSQTELELAKLGVRFKNQFEEDISKEEKATLAYIHDLDDALTAELYDHIETLKQIASTKIYRVHLAHHLFHIRKNFIKSLSDYDIIIVSLDENYALVFTGDKISLPVLTVQQLAWSHESDGDLVVALAESTKKLYQSEIVSFETSLPAGVQPWFTQQPAKRIYDRSLVILDGHDGSAMADLLREKLELPDVRLGGHQAIEAASLCRWQNDSWFKQAEQLGRSKEDLRGLVAIDGSIVTPEFSKIFQECLTSIKKLSS